MRQQQQQTNDNTGGKYVRRWIRKTVTLCHFNVLCQKYETNHLGDECRFANRAQKIFDAIWRSEADVLSLNECNPVSAYRAQFSSAFDILYVSKTDTRRMESISVADMRANNSDSDDGTALCFRRGTVELVNGARIPFYDPVNSNNDEIDPSVRTRQFALFAHVQHLASGKTFFVATSHFKANNGDTQHMDRQRIAHISQLMPAMAQLRQQGSAPDAPLFLMGDLNADPTSPTMKLLLEGFVDFGGKRHVLGAASAFDSAIKDLRADGTEAPLTILDSSYGNGGWSSTLDYVLYRKSEGAIPIAHLEMPLAEQLGGLDALPHCGSDHIPLVVEFLLK